MDADGNVDPTPAEYTLARRRPRAAGHDRLGARRPDRQPQRDLRLLRRRAAACSYECALDSADLLALRLAEDLQRPAVRPAHLRGPRARPRRRLASRRSRRYEWSVVELDPPETDDRLRPAGPEHAARPATFAFGSDEPDATFQCALDGAASSRACPVPVRVHRPGRRRAHPPGARGRPVRQRRRDRRRATPGRSTPTRTPPTTTIISGPDATTTLIDASFSFTSEPGATFECSLDAEPFAECTSPRGVHAT